MYSCAMDSIVHLMPLLTEACRICASTKCPAWWYGLGALRVAWLKVRGYVAEKGIGV